MKFCKQEGCISFGVRRAYWHLLSLLAALHGLFLPKVGAQQTCILCNCGSIELRSAWTLKDLPHKGRRSAVILLNWYDVQ